PGRRRAEDAQSEPRLARDDGVPRDARRHLQTDVLAGPAAAGARVPEYRSERSGARLNDVVAFIDRNYAKPLTIATLARRGRLSPFHFIRTFRVATGLTPHQYVRERRLERARHLLSTTAMPVTEVCEAVGFTSLGSFSTLFHRSTGLSPVAYRAAERRPVYIP